MSSALEVWSHNHSATREVPIKYCLIKVCTLFFKKNKVCILLSLFLLLAFRVYWGFPGGSDGIEFARDVGDWDSIPGLGRSPGGGHGNPLQCPRLEIPHRQRSLAGYSPRGHRVGHDCEAKEQRWFIDFMALLYYI